MLNSDKVQEYIKEGVQLINVAARNKKLAHGNNKYPNKDRICPLCLVQKNTRMNWPLYMEDFKPFSCCKLCENVLKAAGRKQVDTREFLKDFLSGFQFALANPDPSGWIKFDRHKFFNHYSSVINFCNKMNRRAGIDLKYSSVVDWTNKGKIPVRFKNLFPEDTLGNYVDPFIPVVIDGILANSGISSSGFAKIAGVAWRDTPWNSEGSSIQASAGAMRARGIARFAAAAGRISQILVLRGVQASDRVSA